MPLFSFASALRPIGVLLLALLLFISPAVFARSSNDPTDVVDQQRAFLDQTMRNIEHQRAEQEAEKKAESDRHLRLQKKRTEQRLAKQLKGLSGTLSGLPELPNFNGKFEMPQSNDERPHLPADKAGTQASIKEEKNQSVVS